MINSINTSSTTPSRVVVKEIHVIERDAQGNITKETRETHWGPAPAQYTINNYGGYATGGQIKTDTLRKNFP